MAPTEILAAVRHFHQPLAILDQRGVVLFPNEAFSATFFPKPRRHAHWSELREYFVESEVFRAIETRILTGYGWQGDAQVALPRAGLREFHIVVDPIELPGSGNVALVLMTDVSDRKLLEKVLRRVAQFTSLSPNPKMEILQDERIGYANAAVTRLQKKLGVSTPTELLPPNLNTLLVMARERSGESVPGVRELKGCVLEWLFNANLADEVVYAHGVDVTEQRKMEASMRQLAKFEALGTLAAGLGHDLNNFLGIIRGHCDLTLAATKPTPDQKRYLTSIQETCERALSLIRQLRELSQPSAPTRSPSLLAPLLKKLLAVFSSSAPAGIKVSLKVEEGLPPVWANEDQLSQVFVNLVLNALEAMGTEGELTISLSASDASGSGIDRRQQSVTVTDTGPGLPVGVIEKVFEPFYSTKRKDGPLSGIGLAVSYKIVTEHGGSLIASNAPEGGGQFRVTLPSMQDDVQESDSTATRKLPSSVEAEPANLQGKRVLLVEDEQPLLEVNCRQLEGFGCRVTVAHDGQEAFDEFLNAPSSFDALVSDVGMPKLDGLALVQKVKEIRPELPVLIITAFLSADLDQHLRRAGANLVLNKPVDQNQLRAALQEILAQG